MGAKTKDRALVIHSFHDQSQLPQAQEHFSLVEVPLEAVGVAGVVGVVEFEVAARHQEPVVVAVKME